MLINKKTGKKRGFTLVEIVFVIAILAVLTTFIGGKIGDTITAAKNYTKQNNAITMNKLMDEVRSLGGTVADGSGNDIDTSSMETLIESLTKEPPLNVIGITFGIKPKPNPQDYSLVMKGREKNVEAVIESNS